MASESMSTQHSHGLPATAAEHLNLAERFMSFAEYAASTSSLPQTAATSLDVARFHAFTGELTFAVDPAVRLYLDGGSVYHAERDGGPTVSRVLLDAGVIDSMQLQRGVVSVGDVDHLGRLFDRDATVDRDAVMVVVESATAALLQQIANSVIATVTVSAYRHHPSGIHRWFVAPVEPTGVQRPASGVMQVDRSVVEELPQLGPQPEALAGVDVNDVPWSIEWADSDLSSAGVAAPEGDEPPHIGAADKDVDIQAELDRFDADRADWAATSGGIDPDATQAVSSPLGEFRIVWPDGTRDASIIAPDESASDIQAVEEPVAPLIEAALEPPRIELEPPRTESAATGTALPAPTVTSAPVDAPGPETPASGPVGFMIEPLRIDRIPEPDAAVPDDVATAVRRALQAIETASSRPASASVPELHLSPLALPELSAPSITAPVVAAPAPAVEAMPPSAVPVPSAAQPSAGERMGFAPPTMDMRAEAVYERAAAEAPADAMLAEEIVLEVESSHPETDGPAVAVVVDDAAGERQGALRRLIGSLRSDD